jgi:uncharacterized membrane protein
MGRITVSRRIHAPVELVFGYVDDHRNTTKYMKDLTKWQPVGEKTHGKGAHFEVAMKAGPSTLDSSVEITAWTESKVIGWVSRKGFKQNGKWSFRAADGGSEVTFDMEYEFGGGIAGRFLGKAAEPFVRSNIEKSVDALKAQTEKLAPRPSAKASAKVGANKTAKAATRPPKQR